MTRSGGPAGEQGSTGSQTLAAGLEGCVVLSNRLGTRAPIGVIRSQPESRRLLEQALDEIYAVAVGNRIALPADTVEKGLAVPLHRLIHAALLPLERSARGEVEFTL